MDASLITATPVRRLAEGTAARSARLAPPAYDRRRLRPGVVHFGVGGFHRAHQAVLFDELAARGISRDWGVVGVAMHSRETRDRLRRQDWLYTVTERDDEAAEARVVGSLKEIIVAAEDPAAVVERLADTTTKLITLTITGGAYKRAASPQPDVFALIAAGLDRRRREGLSPVAVVSCDNLPGNGSAARAATLEAAAELGAPGLSAWIESNVPFPATVVDRITPKPGPFASDFIAREYGVLDVAPVLTEPYLQWTISEDFGVAPRPPLDDLGVDFVADTTAHELAKKRLLNGSHCALAYLGYLRGHRRVDEALVDPLLRDFLRALMDEEITPLVEAPAGLDLGDYKASLIERFSNPAVADRLARLGERGSVKMPSYLLPSVEDSLRRGDVPDLLALAVAGWCRFLRGVDLDGESIDVVDPAAERLTRLARAGGGDPRPLLAEADVFGGLARHEGFVESVRAACELIDRGGVGHAIAERLDAGAALAA